MSKLYSKNLVIGLIFFVPFFLFSQEQADSTQSDTIPMKVKPKTGPPPTERLPDSTVSFTLVSVGDLMCHSPQFKYARVVGDSFDFVPCYEEVLPLLQDADLTFGNLETTLTGAKAGYSGYPAFNAPDDYAAALKVVGFDLLSTTNNHSLDRGEKGVLRTLDVLDTLGIGHVGTYRSEADRDSIRIIDVKGTKLAFLAYTYGMNGRVEPKGKEYLVNEIDSLEQMQREVPKAREMGADLVIVYYHFGNENERLPNAYQKWVVNTTIAAGADVILGGHPHVLQPMEYFETTDSATLDTGFVAWSLGNFLSNQYWRYTDAGVILELEFTRNYTQNLIEISDVNFTPTWTYRGKDPGKKLHVVFPAEYGLEDEVKYLGTESMRKMKQSFNDSNSTLTKYEKGFRRKPLEEWK